MYTYIYIYIYIHTHIYMYMHILERLIGRRRCFQGVRRALPPLVFAHRSAGCWMADVFGVRRFRVERTHTLVTKSKTQNAEIGSTEVPTCSTAMAPDRVPCWTALFYALDVLCSEVLDVLDATATGRRLGSAHQECNSLSQTTAVVRTTCWERNREGQQLFDGDRARRIDTLRKSRSVAFWRAPSSSGVGTVLSPSAIHSVADMDLGLHPTVHSNSESEAGPRLHLAVQPEHTRNHRHRLTVVPPRAIGTMCRGEAGERLGRDTLGATTNSHCTSVLLKCVAVTPLRWCPWQWH